MLTGQICSSDKCYLYSALSVSGTCLFPELPGVGHGVRTRSNSTRANKSKVVLVHYVKAVWGVEVQLHSLSTSALDGSGYSVARLETRNSSHLPGIKPQFLDRPAISVVTTSSTLPRLTPGRIPK
jgi:hypothetical protein